MEKTKLTVRVPRDLLDDAKRYASENNTTLTRLVSEYLRRLSMQDAFLADAPIVRRLSGILPPEASMKDYHDYLEEKYGD
jgi:hypothetical protein